MKLLDIFCGMGGWSIGFYREGFECSGVDCVDVGYPYKLLLSDVRDYHPPKYPKAMVLSPPCTEYSSLTMLSYQKGQRAKPDPEKGNELVREAKRIVQEAEPEYWVLENVWGSIPHITKILGKPILLAKPWVLWGNLPAFMFEFEPVRRGDNKISHTFELGKGMKHGSITNYGKGGDVMGKGGGRIGLPEDFPFDPLRSWKRARIPVWLSQTIARQIKSLVLPAEIRI